MIFTNNWYTYLFEIVGTDSPFCGEIFCTELQTQDRQKHLKYAKKIFPDECIKLIRELTEDEAEILGIDTY